MAKLNWEKRNQQSNVRKKGYEDVSGEISPYKQCTEKQYELIKKLMQQSPANKKIVRQFLFWDNKTNKLLPREQLTKQYAGILIEQILNKSKIKKQISPLKNNGRGVTYFGRGVTYFGRGVIKIKKKREIKNKCKNLVKLTTKNELLVMNI